MIEVHVQAEGAFPNITGRRALLRRLPKLTLQPADDRQRDDDCSHSADQQRAAAHEQADKIVAAARENAENDRKKIVDEANREAVSIAEAAMEKLLAKETSRAYDAFVNAAEGEEKHEHE